METWIDHGELDEEAVAPPRPSASADVRVALIVVAVLAVLGVGLAFLWSAVAPHVPIVITPAGPDLVHYEGDEFFAGDATLVLITLGAGLLAGAAAWWVVPSARGPLTLIGLAVGSLAGAVVAWQIGRHLGLAEYHRLLHSTDVGRTFGKPVDLRAKGVLFVQPFAAVLAYVFLASWDSRPGLGRGSELVQPVGDL